MPTTRKNAPPHPTRPDAPLSRRALGRQVLAWSATAAGLWGALPLAMAQTEPPPTERVRTEQAQATFWAELAQGGCVVLMRHTVTDAGTGDPADFDLNECSTQRNLSDPGKAQARAWGNQFVEHLVKVAEVRTSEWCRCKDTARLAFGRYRVWSPLNSFFASHAGAGQTQDVVRFIESSRTPRNTVLVTHQVNITALTGANPAMGEMLLIRPHTRTQPAAGANSPPTEPYPVLARWLVAA